MSRAKRRCERNKQDYYVTPVPHVELFLRAFESYVCPLPSRILDPCAGGDEKNRMAYPEGIRRHCVATDAKIPKVTTLDIREDSPARFHGDYLKKRIKKKFPLIVTNPPYCLAVSFVEKALQDITDDGFVAFFLRLNFFGANKRADWWQTHMPSYVFVHSSRPGFEPGSKSTDACEYAHFVWSAMRPNSNTTSCLRVIGSIEE